MRQKIEVGLGAMKIEEARQKQKEGGWEEERVRKDGKIKWRRNHHDGAVFASLLILLVFRSWSRIFFSISASVRVSKNGHH